MIEFICGVIIGVILTIVILCAITYDEFKKDDDDFWNQ